MLSEKIKSFSVQNKNLISGSMIIIACLLLAVFFQGKNLSQSVTKDIFFFILIPSLYIKYILKRNLSDFGFNFKNRKTGIFWGLLMAAVLFFAFYFLSTYSNFAKGYKIHEWIVGNFNWFIISELIFVNMIIFIQEFFFRGLVLFLFSEKIGAWSIAVQGILNIILITSGQKLSWTELPLSLIAISSGIIAYKSRSFVYSYLSALLFQILLDSYIIYNIKSIANI